MVEPEKPVFQTYRSPRRPVLAGDDLFQSIMAGAGLLFIGVLFLNKELDGDRDTGILVMCWLFILVGAAISVMVLRDLLARVTAPSASDEPVPDAKAPLWAMPGPYLDTAAERGLGNPVNAYPYHAAPKYLLLYMLSLTTAFIGAILIAMNLDGSTTALVWASVVTGLALVSVAFCVRLRRRPTRRCWVVFEAGLVVVDDTGAAAAVLRWDEITRWYEFGDLPGAKKAIVIPLSILLIGVEGTSVTMRAQEVAGVAELRSDLISGMRDSNPGCPGLPAA